MADVFPLTGLIADWQHGRCSCERATCRSGATRARLRCLLARLIYTNRSPSIVIYGKRTTVFFDFTA